MYCLTLLTFRLLPSSDEEVLDTFVAHSNRGGTTTHQSASRISLNRKGKFPSPPATGDN